MNRFERGAVRRWGPRLAGLLLLVGLALGGCGPLMNRGACGASRAMNRGAGGASRAMEECPDEAPRPAAERLLSLLPAGQEAVFDVDVGGLRQLPQARELLADLPESTLRLLTVFTEAPLRDLDALAVGVSGLGTPGVNVTFIARGRLGEDHLKEALAQAEASAADPHADPLGEVRESEYHGARVFERIARVAEKPGVSLGGRAAAMLVPGVAALGSREAVRQAIDNLHGDSLGAEGQADLMAALSRAPRAKEGRPAVLMALIPPTPLRDRLREADLAELGSDARYLAASLAVGDGVDLGGQAGYAEFGIAQSVARHLKERVEALGRRPALSLLGLSAMVEPFIFVAARGGPNKDQPEVHFAYRLADENLVKLIQRIGKLRGVHGAGPR